MKLQINVYKGLPMLLGKIKVVSIAAVIGKSDTWIHMKMRHNEVKGKSLKFVQSDLDLINISMPVLGDEILQSLVVYSPDRENVIPQIRELSKLVSMQYICMDVMGKKKRWYDTRMAKRTVEGKASSFKEEDVLQINMAAMNIANELKNIEFTL